MRSLPPSRRVHSGSPKDMGAALLELGVKVSREDQLEVYGWCPLHEKIAGKADNKPSWSINRSNGYHHCFSCGYGGSFLTLVMDMAFENDAFAASRWIRKFGIELVAAEDLPDYMIREYEQDEEPVVTEASLARFFLPPEGPLEKRAVTLESCEFYEILWDVIEFGWVFPIREPSGNLIGWQFKNERRFLNYPDGVSKGHCVFGLDKVDDGAEVTVVESPIDTAYMRSAGVPDVVSSMGADVTDQQMRAILTKTDRVCFALDNDTAGKKATRSLARGEFKRGKEIRRGWAPRFTSMTVFDYTDLGEGKDPGELSYEDCRLGWERRKSILELGLAPVDRTPLAERVAKKRAR